MSILYDPHPLLASHRLDVGGGHELDVYETGDPDGAPVVVLHGGPGGGIGPGYARYFDPGRYRVVLFDQRGAGASTPSAGLEHNTTWDLVEDLERIRRALGVARWHVFGGSWGATLALAYAATHADRVLSLCLRGIFLARAQEVRWLYQFGASEVYPDAWEGFVAPIPEAERGDLVRAYHARLTGGDDDEALRCARAWSLWEGSISKLQQDPAALARYGDDAFVRKIASIECHYFANASFFAYDGWLLDQVDAFRGVPAVLVQGRYDMVCPPRSAWDLHRAWPEADLELVHAGHSMTDPEIAAALVRATDRFAGLPWR